MRLKLLAECLTFIYSFVKISLSNWLRKKVIMRFLRCKMDKLIGIVSQTSFINLLKILVRGFFLLQKVNVHMNDSPLGYFFRIWFTLLNDLLGYFFQKLICTSIIKIKNLLISLIIYRNHFIFVLLFHFNFLD